MKKVEFICGDCRAIKDCPHPEIAEVACELIEPICDIEVKCTAEVNPATGKHAHKVEVKPEKAFKLFKRLYDLLIMDLASFMMSKQLEEQAAMAEKENGCNTIQ